MVQIIDVILPIFTLIVAALLTIPVFKLARKSNYKNVIAIAWFIAIFAIVGISVANLTFSYFSIADPIALNLNINGDPASPFQSSFLIDALSLYMAIIIVAVSIVVIIYSVFFIDSAERPTDRYFAVMLMLTSSLLGAVFAGDLLTLFIFWEIATVSAAFLMMFRKNAFSINATMKYLIMVIIASAFVLLGLSLVFGITGSLNYIAVSSAISTVSSANMSMLIIAFVFIAAGYAIEAAIVPFHFWLPDAYTAAPAPSATFLSALVDQGSYYILIRILLYIVLPPGQGPIDWTIMLAVLAALTMIVGNIFALVQNDIKRLMAYICVADVGYNLIAITSATALGVTGNLYFFLIGGLTTALAFMTVGIMNSHGFKTLDDVAGLGKKMPWVSIALIIAGLSFAGVPPLGGFMAKYFVFTAAIEANYSWLAVIGVLTSVLQTAYIFRLVNVMYGKEAKDDKPIVFNMNKKVFIPIFIMVAAIFILGLFPNIVLDLIQPVINQLPFITLFI
ncbi:MAG: NADH-quinone oxidoreductase subunit N [Candidatus Bathyarchaeia archaeon]|jgi:proton-translocating NADH-quinone oxidoreductase chain N